MLKWLWLSLAVLVLDQLTKQLAEHYLQLHDPVAVVPGFNLMLAYNTGAAFSFLHDAGGWQRWFFALLSSVVSAGIVWWMWRLDASERWLAIALALILGGALGNLWDRILLGHVVDFVQLYYRRWAYPAFNIADSAITAGAIMLIIDSLFFKRESHSRS
ncbi:MAG TPA: lipoprotein signal peptidase [Gammaproteobacteria bacterium]|nr:lipoprotein signal peptidase [Gammaproteobacteria bacterium]